MYLTLIKQFWKQIVVGLMALCIAGLWFTVHNKNFEIENLHSNLRAKEAELALSNSSVSALQREVEMQNQKMDEVIKVQTIKQNESKEQLQKLQAEKRQLQEQMVEVMSVPETGDECKDVLGLLGTVGE